MNNCLEIHLSKDAILNWCLQAISSPIHFRSFLTRRRSPDFIDRPYRRIGHRGRWNGCGTLGHWFCEIWQAWPSDPFEILIKSCRFQECTASRTGNAGIVEILMEILDRFIPSYFFFYPPAALTGSLVQPPILWRFLAVSPVGSRMRTRHSSVMCIGWYLRQHRRCDKVSRSWANCTANTMTERETKKLDLQRPC